MPEPEFVVERRGFILYVWRARPDFQRVVVDPPSSAHPHARIARNYDDKKIVGVLFNLKDGPVSDDEAAYRCALIFGCSTTRHSRNEWLERFNTAKNATPPPGVLSQLWAGTRTLKVIAAGPKPSANDPAFLDELLDRFERVSAIPVTPTREDSADFVRRLDAGEADLALGVFATIDRALRLRFFLTPFRFGLNGVFLRSGGGRSNAADSYAARLKEALTPGGKLQGLVRPVVVRNDVGHIYVARMLNYSATGIDVVTSSEPARLAANLKENEGDDSTRRVIVCDEVLALNVLAVINADASLGGRGALVFSLTDRDSVQVEKRPLPEFMMGIAVGRENRDIHDYFSEALVLFLQTELETTSDSYARTVLMLRQLATQYYLGRGRSNADAVAGAEEWAKYASRLDSPGTFESNLPWQKIMVRAKEKCGLSDERDSSPERSPQRRHTSTRRQGAQ